MKIFEFIESKNWGLVLIIIVLFPILVFPLKSHPIVYLDFFFSDE